MPTMKILWEKSPRGLKRKYKSIRYDVLRELAFYWWDSLFPKRFEESNRGEYGIKKRTKKHIQKKERKGWGVGKNLFYTGLLYDKTTRIMPKPIVNKSGLKMTFRGLPKYIGLSRVREDGFEGDERNDLQIQIEKEFKNNIYLAQRELQKQGINHTLIYLSAAQQGLLQHKKSTHNLPPMKNELVAVSFKDEKLMREFLKSRTLELMNKINDKKITKQV